MADVAAKAAQGGRAHMEDFVRVVHDFRERRGALYAAVFDGHGGAGVAMKASERLHGILAAESSKAPVDAALQAAFRTFDEEVASDPSGSTAVVLLLEGSEGTVANAGDSHAMLVSAAASRIITEDHRLTNEDEYRRVVAAGAKIWGPYMCLPDGSGVMTTRALGDRAFRAIGQVSEPSVASFEVGPEDTWIVLASDGVWDVVEPEVVADLARGSGSARAAVEGIVQAGLAFGTDNVSAVVVRL